MMSPMTGASPHPSPPAAGRILEDRRRTPPASRQAVAGAVVAAVLVAVLTAAMVPVRAHLSVATTALVLGVPVVVGGAGGGFGAGVIATATGFLAYDAVFIPPYYTLSVGAGQNWAALGVYAVVMVVVARLVARAARVREATVSLGADELDSGAEPLGRARRPGR